MYLGNRLKRADNGDTRQECDCTRPDRFGAPRVASVSGYFASPWPGEDGGPARLQVPRCGTGLNLQPGEKLRCVTRNTIMSTMTVLGGPGEVYLLTHSALRSNFGLPTNARVERIDPETLKPLDRSPQLPGGPMWPGGIAVHANGDLYVVYGRYAHRLDRNCRVKAALELPLNLAYNSFVILDNGLIVTKNLSDSVPARFTVIDPETMRPVCADITTPEPSIARLSATGNTVTLVGTSSIFRYQWDGASLAFNPDWRFDYIGDTCQSYGWDVTLDGTNAWFMDNGRHRYRTSMIGRGVVLTPNRLIRVSMTDSTDHGFVPVSGTNGGSITNPPLFDTHRQILIGFDSANRHLQAWRHEMGRLAPLWHKTEFGVASHMILWPDTGELVVNDYRRLGEEVVVLDIESGAERGRVRIGGLTQGVVFPSAGWNRDLYWCSLSKVARVFVDKTVNRLPTGTPSNT